MIISSVFIYLFDLVICNALLFALWNQMNQLFNKIQLTKLTYLAPENYALCIPNQQTKQVVLQLNMVVFCENYELISASFFQFDDCVDAAPNSRYPLMSGPTPLFICSYYFTFKCPLISPCYSL